MPRPPLRRLSPFMKELLLRISVATIRCLVGCNLLVDQGGAHLSELRGINGLVVCPVLMDSQLLPKRGAACRCELALCFFLLPLDALPMMVFLHEEGAQRRDCGCDLVIDALRVSFCGNVFGEVVLKHLKPLVKLGAVHEVARESTVVATTMRIAEKISISADFC